MMTVLLESAGARGPRRGGWTVASVSVHAALIVVAVVVTTQAPAIAEAVHEPVRRIIYEAPSPEDQRAVLPVGPRTPGAPVVPPILINVPDIPMVEINRPFTPTVISHETHPPQPGTIDTGGAAPSGAMHTLVTVDRIAAPRSGNGAPDYPRSLRTAGVEGSVLVTFVVDTLGRAESGSITVVSSTHPLFADAVRQWLGRTRYAPAEIRGMRVRQLVQQEVGFTLAH